MESISLDRLQQIMDKLSADLHNDVRTLENNVELNRGAILGLSTLVQRINAELLADATPIEAEVEEVVDTLPKTTEEGSSSEYSSPI